MGYGVSRRQTSSLSVTLDVGRSANSRAPPDSEAAALGGAGSPF